MHTQKHVTCKFFKNLLLYSGCKIPRGLKYAISKYGNMHKRYISLLLLPGLMGTFLKERESVDFVGIYIIGNKKTKCQLNVNIL